MLSYLPLGLSLHKSAELQSTGEYIPPLFFHICGRRHTQPRVSLMCPAWQCDLHHEMMARTILGNIHHFLEKKIQEIQKFFFLVMRALKVDFE